MEAGFDRDRHVAFFSVAYKRAWRNSSADSMKMTVLYFIISAIDLLDVLEIVVDRKAVVEWIYRQQVTGDEERWMNAGFRVGPCLGFAGESDSKYDYATLASTYCALCMLRILGDDLTRVHKAAIIRAMPFMQQENGCFVSHPEGIECDARFLYCACAISALLNDWNGVDKAKATAYVLNSQDYQGAIGMTPKQEGHAGSTYCAISSLCLMGTLDQLTHRERLVEWLMERQGDGFQGRVNKPLDSCYGFWVGGTCQTMGNRHAGLLNFLEKPLNCKFLYALQGARGGFGKYSSEEVDLVHSYYSLCALSLLK